MTNIIPIICYNQIQAQKFSLNSTKAIIMNYFSYILPNYGEAMNINGLPYYWCGIDKILNDLPTLEIGDKTLRVIVRELLEEGLILREVTSVGGKSRAYYRASEAWIKSSSTASEGRRKSLMEQIEELTQREKEELLNKLSSSMVNNSKSVTVNLGEVGGNFYTDEIVKFFERGKDLFDFSANIDETYVENILAHIDYRMSLTTYWEVGQDGKKSDKTKKEIIKRLNNILDWHEAKNKKIRNLKLTINTFFK